MENFKPSRIKISSAKLSENDNLAAKQEILVNVIFNSTFNLHEFIWNVHYYKTFCGQISKEICELDPGSYYGMQFLK